MKTLIALQALTMTCIGTPTSSTRRRRCCLSGSIQEVVTTYTVIDGTVTAIVLGMLMMSLLWWLKAGWNERLGTRTKIRRLSELRTYKKFVCNYCSFIDSPFLRGTREYAVGGTAWKNWRGTGATNTGLIKTSGWTIVFFSKNWTQHQKSSRVQISSSSLA